MRHHDIYIASLGLALGDEETLATARAQSLISDDKADRTDQRAIRVADPITNLPVDAALDALTKAGIEAPDLGPVYHAINPPADAIEDNPAAGIMNRLGINSSRHPSTTLVNGNQGIIDGLAAAALYLSQPAVTGADHAMVGAGGSWPEEYSRWTDGPCLGDGAGALVLTNHPTTTTTCRLLATVTLTDTTLRELHQHRAMTNARLRDLMVTVTAAVVADAQIEHRNIKHLITPFGNDRPEHAALLPKVNVDQHELDSLTDRRRDIGTLGAADLIAGLAFLNSPKYLSPGDYVLLLADGPASVGAAVLQLHATAPAPATR